MTQWTIVTHTAEVSHHNLHCSCSATKTKQTIPSMLEGTLPRCPSVGSACSPCMHTQLCQPACSDGEGFSCSLAVAMLWVLFPLYALLWEGTSSAWAWSAEMVVRIGCNMLSFQASLWCKNTWKSQPGLPSNTILLKLRHLGKQAGTFPLSNKGSSKTGRGLSKY